MVVRAKVRKFYLGNPLFKGEAVSYGWGWVNITATRKMQVSSLTSRIA